MTVRQGLEPPMAKRMHESRSRTEALMEEVCERQNCLQALRRVKANKGSPGVDGMTVRELPDYLKQHWPAILEQLLSGTYRPQHVRWCGRGTRVTASDADWVSCRVACSATPVYSSSARWARARQPWAAICHAL